MDKQNLIEQKEKLERSFDFTDEEIKNIKEVADEENMPFDEVAELWSIFKETAEQRIVKKNFTKKKVSKDKKKRAKKLAKKAKRNKR